MSFDQNDVFLAGFHNYSLSATDTIRKSLRETFANDRNQIPAIGSDTPYGKALANPLSAENELMVSWAGQPGFDPMNARRWIELHISDRGASAAAHKRILASGSCIECGRKLVPIGHARFARGAGHDDWATRVLHKACWLERKREIENQ
jgi:hypothetical protein